METTKWERKSVHLGGEVSSVLFCLHSCICLYLFMCSCDNFSACCVYVCVFGHAFVCLDMCSFCSYVLFFCWCVCNYLKYSMLVFFALVLRVSIQVCMRLFYTFFFFFVCIRFLALAIVICLTIMIIHVWCVHCILYIFVCDCAYSRTGTMLFMMCSYFWIHLSCVIVLVYLWLCLVARADLRTQI